MTPRTIATEPDSTDDIRGSIAKRGFRWAEKQGPVVVVLLGVLITLVIGLGYGVRYTVVTLVPAHLEAIQEGYERIQADSSRTQKELTDRYLEDKKSLREMHTKELSGLAMEFKGIANQMQEVSKKQDDLIRTLILRENRQRAEVSQ